MSERVFVAGVGMIPFSTPSKSESYDVMGAKAARAALADAGLDYSKIEQAYVGYVYGDSTSGQTALYQLGRTGIPVINVNNNCSTGSTALYLARQAVASGAIECALVLGFEQMQRGALHSMWEDRPNAMQAFLNRSDQLQGPTDAPFAAALFGGAGAHYLEKYDAPATLLADIAVKSRSHAANNPNAVFRTPLTVEEVMNAPTIFGPLTRLMCCPPTCGAAAAVLCTEEFARKHGLDTSVAIAGQAMTTDTELSFTSDAMALVGYGMSQTAAGMAYRQAGVGPEDINVVELHDCFTANELISYESLGLTPEGSAEKFIRDGNNTYGGQVVVNPSGGLMSKGHPLGATGLAQCTELVGQLRGTAGPRQVDGARLALQHNIGLGGAAVVTIYEKVN